MRLNSPFGIFRRQASAYPLPQRHTPQPHQPQAKQQTSSSIGDRFRSVVSLFTSRFRREKATPQPVAIAPPVLSATPIAGARPIAFEPASRTHLSIGDTKFELYGDRFISSREWDGGYSSGTVDSGHFKIIQNKGKAYAYQVEIQQEGTPSAKLLLHPVILPREHLYYKSFQRAQREAQANFTNNPQSKAAKNHNHSQWGHKSAISSRYIPKELDATVGVSHSPTTKAKPSNKPLRLAPIKVRRNERMLLGRADKLANPDSAGPHDTLVPRLTQITTDNRHVSRLHASVEVYKGRWVVVCQSGTNGLDLTKSDGTHSIKGRGNWGYVDPGDTIRIGNTWFLARTSKDGSSIQLTQLLHSPN